MKMHRRIFVSILLIFLIFDGNAQKNHAEHNHDDLHKNHFGIGAAATFLSTEKNFAPGFHLHYIRQFGHEKQWGIGAGFETILDEHTHKGLILFGNYRPVSNLSINAGPGVVFANHNNETEIKPAFHTEAVLEFDILGFHAGPMIGFGIDPEETHFAAGIHIGVGF